MELNSIECCNRDSSQNMPEKKIDIGGKFLIA